jgi:hypothetical protein
MSDTIDRLAPCLGLLLSLLLALLPIVVYFGAPSAPTDATIVGTMEKITPMCDPSAQPKMAVKRGTILNSSLLPLTTVNERLLNIDEPPP